MAGQHETRFPPGAQILVRDEEWLVKNTTGTAYDGDRIEAIGVSEFVRDQEAVFFSGIDVDIELLEPDKTRLVVDSSPYFRRSRLFLEAVLRKTPLPQSERGLALADRFLLDPLHYQLRPAELALSMRNLRPRVLIADVVGLGKTLEIGLTLAELIRRGRGERILVVTPQHVLEQFQHELWTRFAIPLVRLDSLGIQRVQREIPAGRNPFTHYKRVIISVDTLKNIGQYRHHLERIQWDAVVIDESHNLINRGSQRRALAETLAPRTDALLLASATPHNGDKRSFADLISLLDPAAIADPDDYDPERDLGHLFIRRTKVSPEVRNEMGDAWADRGPTHSLHCSATTAEESIFAELTTHWLPEASGSTEFGTADQEPRSVAADPLFAYNLLKSFLSSHVALAQTIKRRVDTLEKAAPGKANGEGSAPDGNGEHKALLRLRELTDEIGNGSAPGDSAKLDQLVAQLEAIGVGPGSAERVVIFSERVPTITWLANVVPPRLGFPVEVEADGNAKNKAKDKAARGAVRLMHGGLSDDEQQKCVEAFGLADDPVRLLFTTDVASEGVNLHRHCNQLIHYDIPWSLIRIEQRNGRIDRYGQRRKPEFRALILISGQDGTKDDRTVAEKLLRREEEAYRLNGTAEAVTGIFRPDEEERRLVRELVEGRTVEQFLDDAPGSDDLLSELFGGVGEGTHQDPPLRAVVPSLFGGETAPFVDAALAEVFDDRAEDALELSRGDDRAGGAYLSLSPVKAPDLLHRLKALPPSYLKEQGIAERMLLTFDRGLADRKLTEARDSSSTIWPTVSFLTDIHPFVEWLTDKVLVRFGQQEAPVITSPHIDGPAFLIQGLYSNARGRPTVVAWMAVKGLPTAPELVEMPEVLEQARIGPDLARTSEPRDLAGLQALVPEAVAFAAEQLEKRRAEWDETISVPLAAYQSRLAGWHEQVLPGMSVRGAEAVGETVLEQQKLVKELRTTGRPLLRVLAVIDKADD